MSTDFAVLASQPDNETSPIAQKLSGKKEPVVNQNPAWAARGEKPSGTTQTASPSPQKRKSKNETGIWIIEKSLDKKNWIATNHDGDLMWQSTRAKAHAVADAANQNVHGIHYRVTRYEPTR